MSSPILVAKGKIGCRSASAIGGGKRSADWSRIRRVAGAYGAVEVGTRSRRDVFYKGHSRRNPGLRVPVLVRIVLVIHTSLMSTATSGSTVPGKKFSLPESGRLSGTRGGAGHRDLR